MFGHAIEEEDTRLRVKSKREGEEGDEDRYSHGRNWDGASPLRKLTSLRLVGFEYPVVPFQSIKPTQLPLVNRLFPLDEMLCLFSFMSSAETQGSDDSIPLLPQWLLAKPAENKHASVAEDPDRGLYTGSTSPSDSINSSPDVENILVTEKKRDIFKPSLHDKESAPHDGWPDEERDTRSVVWGDWLRKGGKDLSDTGKMEWRMDNRESYHGHRRESKWNTRWGPDHKESKCRDEKWSDGNRDSGLSHNKGLPLLTNHGKGREGGHYRPQQSNTAHSYEPGDLSHHRTLTLNKEIPSSGYGRSHGEGTPVTFSCGRVNFGGNFTTKISSSHLSAVNKVETDAGEHFPLRYNRIQLLNVYRMINLTSLRKTMDALIDVPSLTQEEPVEPFALSTPTSDELIILKGIDKGDIVSSGVPQVSKDGSTGRNKFEDLACAINAYEDETSNSLKGLYYEKYGCQHESDSKLETLPRNQSSHDDVEGLGGYTENSSVRKLRMGVEKENELFLLAQKLLLGHQRSYTLPHLLADSSLSQNMDLASIFQAGVEKSSPEGAADWSSFLCQGGIGTSQDIDTYQSGIKQQMLHSENQPSYANTMGQNVVHSPSLAATEKLLSSVLSQDPKMLQALQERRQQILQQLQRQLLLQQQLPRQHEQNKFSRIDESSSGNLQAVGTPPGYVPNDNFGFQAPHEMLQTDCQVPASSKQVSLAECSMTLPSQVPEDVTPGSVSGDNLDLRAPHEMLQPNSGARTRTLQDTTCYATWPSHVSEDVTPGSVPVKNIFFLAPHEMFQTNSQAPTYISPDALTTGCAIFQSQVSQQVDQFRSSEAISPFLPHQFFENTSYTKSWDGILPELADFQHKDINVSSADILEESQYTRSQGDSALVRQELKDDEVREVKKVSEKKPKKQKKSKSQTSSVQANPMPMMTSQLKQPENAGRNTVENNFEKTAFVKSKDKSWTTDIEKAVSGQETSSPSRSISSREVDISQGYGELREDELLPQKICNPTLGHQAWKPAPSPKAKSLLEIQLEEQCRSETSVADFDFGASFKRNSSSSLWDGVASNLKLNSNSNGQQNSGSVGFSWGKSEKDQDLRIKSSNLHDLLAEEVLAYSGDIVEESPGNIPNSYVQAQTIEENSSNDVANFVEPKDARKTWKKSAIGKSVAVQAITDSHPKQGPVSTPLSDPNSGDFLQWKGDSEHLPPPAWSTDSGELSKPTSLMDIQKQQERVAPVQTHIKAHSRDSGKLSKATSLRDIQQEQQQEALSSKQAAPMPTHMKSHSKQRSSGGGPTHPLASSSPSKVECSIQIDVLVSTQPNFQAEDDLFWGPPDQPNNSENMRLCFPSIVNSGSLRTKTTSLKGTPVGLSSEQDSSSSMSDGNSDLVSRVTAQSSPTERKDTRTKHSEAMKFRAWCESELLKLTGSNDPSLLAFCLKQPVSEAEILLNETLGAYDPDHKFIDTFLNQKNIMSTDVLEMAFQSVVGQMTTGSADTDMNSKEMHCRDADPSVDANRDCPKRGKKKGKKGQKVSSLVLGFNVVSNRIMMGEIQSVEN